MTWWLRFVDAGRRLSWAGVVCAIVVGSAAGGSGASDVVGSWEQLEPGLELGRFVSPQPAQSGDSRIHVLRIDPLRFELRLLNASRSNDPKPATPKQWLERNGLAAMINASMYQA